MDVRDVFISYCSVDRPVAEAVRAALESRGVGCWIAPRDITPGQDWSDAIIDAIGACRVFLLVLSGASNQSEQVKRELQNAVGEGRAILPVRIEDVALSKHMRYFIGTPHWLDALTPPVEQHFPKLVEVVSGLLDGAPSDAAEPPPAPAIPALPAPPSISPEAVAAAGKALAHHLGPVAYALAKRAAKTAAGPADFHRLLADHLATPAEKAAFLHTLGG